MSVDDESGELGVLALAVVEAEAVVLLCGVVVVDAPGSKVFEDCAGALPPSACCKEERRSSALEAVWAVAVVASTHRQTAAKQAA